MKKEIAVVDQASIDALRQAYPVEQGFNRIQLPRLGYESQDKFEGKGKEAKVVTEAGTFILETETSEGDKDKKKIRTKEEIGKKIEGVILFQRKQLSLYDMATEKYTSSSVYDTDDQIIPLFFEKKKIATGTPAELKAKYMHVDEKDGKKKSKLKDNRILYVLLNGELRQLSLHGSSMYSFMTYSRKTLPPAVMTEFCSEPKEKGTTEWNMMTFTAKRNLTNEEIGGVLAKVNEIKEGIVQEKAYYANQEPQEGTIEAKVQEENDGFDKN